MNRAEIIAKKHELWSLIRRVGNHYGEDQEFIKEYAKEVFEQNDLQKALDCFRDLFAQTIRKIEVIE